MRIIFLDAAIEEGAAGLLISDASAWQGSREDRGEKRPAVILVDDTLLALQRLAAFQRGMLEMPVIVVTGSSGKNLDQGHACRRSWTKIQGSVPLAEI